MKSTNFNHIWYALNSLLVINKFIYHIVGLNIVIHSLINNKQSTNYITEHLNERDLTVSVSLIKSSPEKVVWCLIQWVLLEWTKYICIQMRERERERERERDWEGERECLTDILLQAVISGLNALPTSRTSWVVIEIDSKVCCTGSGIGKGLFESSMTDWEAEYMFNISAMS